MQMCPNCSQDNPDYAPTCAACSEPLRNLLGQNTPLEGRYRLTRVLGCGGMGAVYLADDNRIAGRQVAVKENLNTAPQAQAQFQAEVSLMVGLNHPGLPRVSDQFVGPTGRRYMVMDYVPGETLEEVVGRRGPPPEAEIAGLAGRLLDILEYLHSHSVVHRDVKPANIKLTPEGKVVLVDFGIAKLHVPGHHTQTWGRRAGSPGFAPLEQYGTGTDARSDLYSLGAVLYYLVTGQAPPEATDLAAGKPLTPPRQVRPDLSPHLQGVIFKAMALDRAQRFQSAAEMRQALAIPGTFGPTISTSPPGALGPTRSVPDGASLRPWVVIGGVAGVVACVVLIGVVFARSLTPVTPAPAPAAAPTFTATPTPRPASAPATPTCAPTERPAPASEPTWTPTPPPGDSPPPSRQVYESAIQTAVVKYGEIKVDATTNLDPSRLDEVLVDPVLERQKRSVCWLRNQNLHYIYSNRSFNIEGITFDDDYHATLLGWISENRTLYRENGDINHDYGYENYRVIYQLERRGSNEWYIYCFQALEENAPVGCSVKLEDPNPCE